MLAGFVVLFAGVSAFAVVEQPHGAALAPLQANRQMNGSPQFLPYSSRSAQSQTLLDNQPPTFPSATTTRSVAENSESGTAVGDPVVAMDAEDTSLSYTLEESDSGAFSIDSGGQLRVGENTVLDHESQPERSVVVRATDSSGATATIEVTITVTNVDEAGSVSLRPAQPRVATAYEAVFGDPDGVVGQSDWMWERSSDQTIWTMIVDFGIDRLSYNRVMPASAGAIYVPTEADRGMYLRVTVSYTDGEGSGKSLIAVSEHVVGQRASSPPLTVVTLVSGLTIPWDLGFTPDGTMLFTERRGVLKARLSDGAVQGIAAGFSDLFVGGTAGLQALVVDPNFVSNRRFYMLQGHTGREMQVIAWTIDEDYTTATRVADPLVGGMPMGPGPNHAGGRLVFGPQGYLWVSTGDGYSGTSAQDLSSPGGKVLRIDSQTGAAAPGNPFDSSLVYAYGFRNPQGLALRRGTNQIWLVDHGPDYDDEINLLIAGDNYGWDPEPDEGVQSSYDETTTPMTDLVKFPDAVKARWTSGDTTIAPGGGTFLEGDDWGDWEGRLAVATLKTQSLRIFEFTSSGDYVSHVVVPELRETYGRLRSPVLGPDGALYVTTSNRGGQDRILKVVPGRPPAFATGKETYEVAENSNADTLIATVKADDPDGEPLTYSLSGVDAEFFSVADTVAGQIRTKVALNYEDLRSYEIVVTASDPYGLSDSLDVTVTVTDIDEPPIAVNDTATTDEDADARLIDVLANDRDPEGEMLTVSLRTRPTGGSATVGADNLVSYQPKPNTHGMDSFAYAVSDGAHTATATVFVTVGPINDPPEFASPDIELTVARNTAEGTMVGAPVTATDIDGDILTYRLSGSSSFEIEPHTAQITIAAGAVLDSGTHHAVTVTASDPSDAQATVTVTINVAARITPPPPPPPVITGGRGGGPDRVGGRAPLPPDANRPPEFSEGSRTVRTMGEHAPAGTEIGTPVTATDPDEDPLTYKLAGTDADSFDLDTFTGRLRTKAALDYEHKNSYAITIEVRDNKDPEGEPDQRRDDSIRVTITITNQDDLGWVTLSAPTPRVDQPLHAVLADPDGDITTITWKWERSPDRSNWTPITDATTPSYTPAAGDADHYLRVVTRYDDSSGSDKTATTAPHNPVTLGHVAAFTDVMPEGVHTPAINALAAGGTFVDTECGHNRFCPNQPIQRRTMAIWLIRILGGNPPITGQSRFHDIPDGQWWIRYVKQLADRQITLGCSTDPPQYCPNRSVNRAQMASFLARAFQLPVSQTPAGFADTQGTVHAANINTLAAAGITIGCSTDPLRYCPNQPVTRAQMARFLHRALNHQPTNELGLWS